MLALGAFGREVIGRGSWGRGIGHCSDFGGGLFFGGLHILFSLALLAAVIALIVYLVKKRKKDLTAEKTTTDAALDTLKMKLVQGEISEEEYLRKKELLSNQ